MSIQSIKSLVPTSEHAQEGDEIYKEEDEDLCVSIDGSPDTLYDKESPRSMMDKEISVDPISLKQSTNTEAGYHSLAPSIITTTTMNKDPSFYPPLPLPPAKSKFLSSSLPNSVTSSPRSGSTLMKNIKKWRNQSQQASPRAINSLARQHSVALSHFAPQRETHLRRSKSCGEGRSSAPTDEFDLWSKKVVNSLRHENGDDDHDSHYEYERDEVNHKNRKNSDPYEAGFKCGALCLFLPGFGKGKPVRARKWRVHEEEEEVANVVSRTVSLEKFECGSWSSSAIINDEENGESMNLYYDLPLELIKNCANDANSPVATAFLFERDRKSVLKKCTSRGSGAKSQESPRHVRFSTSNPVSYPASPSSCITPRLRKAREDFNAYLEAQGA